MLDIHNRKISIISPYAQDYETYMAMLDFLNAYIRRIEDFLDTASVTDDQSDIPFAVLGSTVYAEGCESPERSVYKIVLPEETQQATVSAESVHACLTPVSDALLFKKKGDRVTIKEQGRTKRYTIKKIVV